MTEKAYPWGRRGAASFTPEQKQRIASMGGKAAQASGKAHRWTVEEARAAGKLGGRISRGGRGKVQA